jgi:hypothetical protein
VSRKESFQDQFCNYIPEGNSQYVLKEVVALFENLFEDEDLNDGFSRAMSHKWREILEELLSIYGDYYGKVYGEVLDNFLSKVPLDELFDGLS